MFSKSTLFSLAILASAWEIHGQADDQVTAINDINDLVQKLRAAVDKAVAKAQYGLDVATAKVNQTAQKVENLAVQEMQGMEQKLEEQVDKLKQKAKDAGVNIDDCLGADEQRLVSLPNVYADELVHCVEDLVLNAIGIAQNALDQIKAVVNDIENIKSDIQNCGHSWTSVACLAKLTVRVTEDIVLFPEKIEADGAAAEALISALVPAIEECSVAKTKACAEEGGKILGKISLCVAGKIVIP